MGRGDRVSRARGVHNGRASERERQKKVSGDLAIHATTRVYTWKRVLMICPEPEWTFREFSGGFEELGIPRPSRRLRPHRFVPPERRLPLRLSPSLRAERRGIPSRPPPPPPSPLPSDSRLIYISGGIFSRRANNLARRIEERKEGGSLFSDCHFFFPSLLLHRRVRDDFLRGKLRGAPLSFFPFYFYSCAPVRVYRFN